jgi:hypothetical protein
MTDLQRLIEVLEQAKDIASQIMLSAEEDEDFDMPYDCQMEVECMEEHIEIGLDILRRFS